MQKFIVELTAEFEVEGDEIPDVSDLMDNFIINNIDTHDYVRFNGHFQYSIKTQEQKDAEEKSTVEKFSINYQDQENHPPRS